MAEQEEVDGMTLALERIVANATEEETKLARVLRLQDPFGRGEDELSQAMRLSFELARTRRALAMSALSHLKVSQSGRLAESPRGTRDAEARFGELIRDLKIVVSAHHAATAFQLEPAEV